MTQRREPYFDAALMYLEAERQRREVQTACGSLSAVAFERRPEERKWSVGECLEHLSLMNTIYLDALDPVIADGRARGLTAAAAASRRHKRHGWLGDLFVRSLEPPPRFKGGAFKRTVPTPQRARERVLDDFMAVQDRLAHTLDGVRDLDLARVRTRSPLFRPLPLSLGQAFGAMLAHNRRHIWQVENILGRKV